MSNSENNEKNSDFSRRPNPKGWTPPKAPYNPYDPNDIRPAEGYPSEFQIPNQEPKGFSSLPKKPTQYQKINETMTRLNYTARPKSNIYPNQYKVLRQVDTNKNLHFGSRWFSIFIGGSIIIYGVFFQRWNNGKENVFSDFYRSQLRFKERMFGGLNEMEYDDLYHSNQSNTGGILKNVKDAQYINEDIRRTNENDFVLNRPSERHILEAQRIQQENEERMLREMDTSKK
ncbi:uncharacterized protein KGF55_003328 [Candida pseudojiufengensis]|uniref:uncharacterized protein n=1 Tax=Candida pseudojiufengensis TaxID=497109 RepID=UPI00222407CD|nr:uncharacterized protein KGF55_003328 [Candida pseudojiufengensis]KAI5962252.1 hypothetical protein KGF55_003328 [Candida pseudojiufengensis]